MREALNSINMRNKLITKINETLLFTAYFRLRTHGWKEMHGKVGLVERESWVNGGLVN